MDESQDVIVQMTARLQQLDRDLAAGLKAMEEQVQASQQAAQAAAAGAAFGRVKLPQPKQWDGKGDMLSNFEIPLTRFLQHHNLHESRAGVDHALAYLPADLSLRAAAHWQYCAQAGTPTPGNLQELFGLIRTWRPQPDRVRTAREKLEILKQRRGKLTFYNEDFTRLAMELGAVMSIYDLNWRYVHGLQPTILREIDGKFDLATSSLSDIMTLANSAESRLRQTGETVQRYYPAAHVSASDGPAPMEVNAIGKLAPRGENGPAFRGKCFKCGKVGHKAAYCKSKNL